MSHTSIAQPESINVQVSYESGWTLFSIPVDNIFTPDEAFPDAISIFRYEDGDYVIPQELIPLETYWVLHHESGALSFEGSPLGEAQLDIESGWNLVGSLSSTVALSEVAQSPLYNIMIAYSYSGGQFTTASDLKPGYGYWILANQSGSLGIQLPTVLVSEDLVIIEDSEAELVSSDSERQQGVYIFDFSTTPPLIEVGDIVTGTHNEPYLRKVTGMRISGNSITLETVQASFPEALEHASFQESVTLELTEAGFKRNDDADWGHTTISYLAPGVSVTETGLSLAGVSIASENGLDFRIKDGSISFQPELLMLADFSFFRLDHFSTQIYGTVESSIDLELSATRSVNLDVDFEIAEFRKPFLFFAGSVPVIGLVILNVNVGSSLNTAAGAMVTYPVSSTSTVAIGMEYARTRGDIDFFFDSAFSVSGGPAMIAGQRDFETRLAVYPEVKVLLYGIAGPTGNIEPFGASRASESTGGDWDASIDLGLDASIGVTADFVKLLSGTLSIFAEQSFNGPRRSLWNTPERIDIISGDNQSGEPDEHLENHLQVQVLSSDGSPIQGVAVYFEVFGGEGTVSSDGSVLTDENGMASVGWTLGSLEGQQQVKAFMRNGSNEIVQEVLFTAEAVESLAPVLSNFEVTFTTSDHLPSCIPKYDQYLYHHRFNYSDPDGDLTPNSEVVIESRFSTSNHTFLSSFNLIHFQFPGVAEFFICYTVDTPGTSIVETITLTDEAGNVSNTLSVTLRPNGSILSKMLDTDSSIPVLTPSRSFNHE